MNNNQFFFNKTFYQQSKSKYYANSFLPFLELIETPSFSSARKKNCKEVLSSSSIVASLKVSSCLTPLATEGLGVDSHVFGNVQHLTHYNNMRCF